MRKRLGVRGGGALGVAGRAGREDQVRGVVGSDGVGSACRLGWVDGVARSQEVGEADDRGGRRRRRKSDVGASRREEDDPPEVTDVLADEEGGVIDAQEAPHGDEQGRARRAEDVRGLRTFEASVEWHQHRSGAERAERGEHPFGAVRRPHGHPVAGVDPGGDEAAGVAVDLGGQLGEGQPHVSFDERLERGVSDRGVLDQARHRAPEQVRSWVLLVGRRSADAAASVPESGWSLAHAASTRWLTQTVVAHGCWLLTEMTSPLM